MRRLPYIVRRSCHLVNHNKHCRLLSFYRQHCAHTGTYIFLHTYYIVIVPSLRRCDCECPVIHLMAVLCGMPKVQYSAEKRFQYRLHRSGMLRKNR